MTLSYGQQRDLRWWKRGLIALGVISILASITIPYKTLDKPRSELGIFDFFALLLAAYALIAGIAMLRRHGWVRPWTMAVSGNLAVWGTSLLLSLAIYLPFIQFSFGRDVVLFIMERVGIATATVFLYWLFFQSPTVIDILDAPSKRTPAHLSGPEILGLMLPYGALTIATLYRLCIPLWQDWPEDLRRPSNLSPITTAVLAATGIWLCVKRPILAWRLALALLAIFCLEQLWSADWKAHSVPWDNLAFSVGFLWLILAVWHLGIALGARQGWRLFGIFRL